MTKLGLNAAAHNWIIPIKITGIKDGLVTAMVVTEIKYYMQLHKNYQWGNKYIRNQ